MNPNEALTPPLTFAEAIQLIAFLAERGHRQAALDIATSVALGVVLAGREVGAGCICDGSGRTCPRHGAVI